MTKESKESDKTKAGISAAGAQSTEKSADENQVELATSEIKTVEDLKACYPELISEIRDESEIKTVEDLKACYPELISEIRDESEIKTVKDLEACYPELISEIRDELIAQIGKSSVQKLKANLPDLYQRIVMDVQGKSGPDLNVPGFLLEIDDPVAAGTLRTFQKMKGVDNLHLPYVLPFKDKNTKAALVNYITRADGCGDTKRADAARYAMKKIK